MRTARPASSSLTRVLRALAAFAILVGATSCATPDLICQPTDTAADKVYVMVHGWHVEVGMAADRLEGPLGVFYRDVFPGAKAVMFGFGKRTFMTARPQNLSHYLLGPFPGDAVIQATGLNVAPPEAYAPGATLTLALPVGGAAALSDFIWNNIGKDIKGQPRLVAPGNFPGSLFYAAKSEYSLVYTCNTWAADALAASGLPVSGQGVILSGQAVARAETVLAGQCAAPAPAGH